MFSLLFGKLEYWLESYYILLSVILQILYLLFVLHIRPIMDLGSTAWNFRYLGDIMLLESI